MHKVNMTQETEVAEVEPQVETQVEQVQPERKSASENFEHAREVMRLQQQRIKELEDRIGSSQPATPQEEPDEFDKLDEDDVITVAQARLFRERAKKDAAKEAAKVSRQVMEEYSQQQRISSDEQRMRAKHDDFDYVIENFALSMIKNDPALAYKVQNSKNPAETAYKLAKISDEYEEANMKQQVSPKAEKVLRNTSRPVSAQSASSPLKAQADDFSKMSPADIWSMSQKFARQA